jgi:hypothetical protein
MAPPLLPMSPVDDLVVPAVDDFKSHKIFLEGQMTKIKHIFLDLSYEGVVVH